MLRRNLTPAIALALATLALGGCGTTRSGTTAAAPTTPRLRIASYAFHPQTLTVKAGTKIVVTNNDATAHTATAKSGAFDSGTLKPGQTMRFTLNKPGVYQYYCQFHAFMTGTIKVVR
jgi:plastocyanin